MEFKGEGDGVVQVRKIKIFVPQRSKPLPISNFNQNSIERRSMKKG